MSEMPNALYGRNRQSIADLEEALHDLFQSHSDFYENAQGQPVLPGRCLPDIFDAYHRRFGIELIARDELQQLMELLEHQPDIEATPDVLLELVAQRTSQGSEGELDDGVRGRDEDRTADRQQRSSSTNSNDTYYAGSRPPSRPPSRGGTVPPSPFDSQKRQRSTPLGPTAPSSWSRRPVAPARRKSDAGHSRAVSDSESSGNGSYGRRRPSSGQSAAQPFVSPDSSMDFSSPPVDGPYSRPHSRAHSQPHNVFVDVDHSYDAHSSDYGSTRPELSRSTYEALHSSISSLPMPRTDGDDDDDDDIGDDPALGLIMERSAASSTVSMEDAERLEALRKVNDELRKKLVDTERTLQRKLDEHELELEQMEQKLEERQAELTAAKREEKELRGKERSLSIQISGLEAEMAKIQKALESSRTAYTSLQRQYQEQLSESEGLRNTLRRKEDQIQELQTAHSLLELEQSKWTKEQDQYDERIAQLLREIEIAHETERELSEQKHENLLLKETIDRLRFDMDELRHGQSHSVQASGGSQPSSISKSLGAEMSRRIRQTGEGNERSSTLSISTVDQTDLEDDDDEEVITTVRRRKRRALPSQPSGPKDVTVEVVDVGTQYDPAFAHSAASVQTDPERKALVTSAAVQTKATLISVAEVQTDEPLTKVLVDEAIQALPVEELLSRSSSPQPGEDSMASSSSTVVPPTPKVKSADLPAPDLPPSYNTIATEALFHNLEHLLHASESSFAHISDPDARRELIAAAQAIRRYHKGLQIPLRSGVSLSPEAEAGWRALQQELGISCSVIEKAIAGANIQTPKQAVTSDDAQAPALKYRWRDMIFQQLIIAGVMSVGVFVAMQPLISQPYHVPGGPTYYDRAAWNSFNALDAAGAGFSPSGTQAVWDILSRLSGGAARAVRHWPT